MAAKKYHVTLTVREHQELEQMLRRGHHTARELTRARILLRAAEGLTDEEIAEEVDTSVPTVERTRQRFVAEHLGALTERPRPGKPPVLQEKGQARLIAEACSTAPGGRERWTMQLLADRVVELGLAEACSADTVGRVLKKTSSNPGSNSNGVFRR
jgi:putative transposase